MGTNNAWQALTNPDPTEREKLLLFLVDCAQKRFDYRSAGEIKADDVWYLLCILYRWDFLTSDNTSSMGRKALGGIVKDVIDMAAIIQRESVK